MRATGYATGAHAGAFIAGPRIYDANEQRFLPELMTSGVAVRRVRVEGERAPQRCAFLISSGSVISRGALRAARRFDEALSSTTSTPSTACARWRTTCRCTWCRRWC
ncbi:hypothetical protein [Burkholderia pseudomallei]|uniref:hypothetical protein n=1 Tax=Burkholderia pseudomallei TaxID=28450 RepID=UPI003AAE484F